jgi:hypothetical protein
MAGKAERLTGGGWALRRDDRSGRNMTAFLMRNLPIHFYGRSIAQLCTDRGQLT